MSESSGPANAGLAAKRTSAAVLAAGIGVVVLWASAFPAIRVAAPELGVIGLSFVRLIVASIALLAFARIARVRMPRRADLPLITLCGFFGMTAYQLLLNWGELTVPAGTASMIIAAAPIISVTVAWCLYRERMTALRMLGSGVALAGVALVCLARSGLTLSAGVTIIVAAMLAQGIYHPLTRPLLRRYSGLEVATYAMIAGTIMTLPFVPWSWQDLATTTPVAWLSGLYLGLLPSALGFVLWGYAVARLSVATSTSLLYLVPPVAVIIAYLWLGEVPYPIELAGGVVIVVGVLAISQGDRILKRARQPRLRAPRESATYKDGLDVQEVLAPHDSDKS